jgi:hypothetical protein
VVLLLTRDDTGCKKVNISKDLCKGNIDKDLSIMFIWLAEDLFWAAMEKICFRGHRKTDKISRPISSGNWYGAAPGYCVVLPDC